MYLQVSRIYYSEGTGQISYSLFDSFYLYSKLEKILTVGYEKLKKLDDFIDEVLHYIKGIPCFLLTPLRGDVPLQADTKVGNNVAFKGRACLKL